MFPEAKMIGAQVEERFAVTIRAKIKSLLGSKTEWFFKDFAIMSDCDANRFSGAQPEHLTEDDLDILEQHDYFLSKKGVGVRCMLFLFITTDGPAAFLVLKQISFLSC